MVSGTNQWNTTPPASCVFQPDGTNRWILDFVVDNSKNNFKFLAKDNGQPGQDWGWGAQINNIQSGLNMNGGGGGDMQLRNYNTGDAVRMVMTYDPGSNQYTISVVQAGLYISADVPNPINAGTTVTLTAEGANSSCSWEYSTNGGITWETYSGATSGTLNEHISVTPSEDTKYRVTSGGETAAYEVVISNMRYAVSGGVVSGTPQWNTTPSEECIFREDGAGGWTLDFVYDNKSFKLISKDGGRAGEDWSWSGQVNNVDNGTNVTGCCGGDMNITGFSSGDAVRLVLRKKSDGRFELSAEAGHLFRIHASRPNPVVQGDDLTLSVPDAESMVTWEYSYDGVTWSPFTGSTSGTNHETIAPGPIVSTYYRASDGEASDIYHVQVIIKCSGNSQTHLEENFGTLSSATARKRDSHVPASYVYSAEGKEVHDGFYSVVANPLYCGRGDRTTPGDCHAESCIGNVRGDGNYWYVDRTDHTGDPNGGMLLLNCNNKGEVMYSYKQTGLCKNIYMTFSAWFASASSGIPIKTRFLVLDKNGNEILSARFDVDAISTSDGWKQGQTAFFSGDNDELTVQIVNNGQSGSGNDILVDDITFTSCIPKLEIHPGLDVICGDNSTLEVESEGIEQIFGVAPYYLWQVFDEDAADPNDPWVDIADDPVPGRASHGGSGIDKVSYDSPTRSKDEHPKYRVIMSADPTVAHQVGHGIFPVCNVYAETEIAIVSCDCTPQTITKVSGDDTQEMCEGENISSVQYSASGIMTTGVGTKGLPTGMSAVASGKNLTISGQMPVTGVETDYEVKIFAVGDGPVCPSDTLLLNLKSFPNPDAPSIKF